MEQRRQALAERVAAEERVALLEKKLQEANDKAAADLEVWSGLFVHP